MLLCSPGCWFLKATTREAYRGSRPPVFPQQEEFTTLSDNSERNRKVEEENALRSRALRKGQSSCPANRGSSTRAASQGLGRRAAGSHLPFSFFLFFVCTPCALQGVRNSLVFPPVSVPAFQQLLCTLQDGDFFCLEVE